MNKKISKTLLVLFIIYAIAFYILKYAFPEIFIEMLISPTVMKFANFVDSWIGYQHIFKLCTTILTLYLFVCSSCGRFKFKWYELLYILIGSILCRCCIEFAPDFYTHTSISIMFLLAYLCKGRLSYSVSSFIIHGYLSQLTFKIKGFETIILHYNLVNGLMLSLEVYMWLIVLALFFSLKESKNG